MSAKSVVPQPFRPRHGRDALREGLDAAAHLLGFAEPRADREPGALTIRLGAPGDLTLVVVDRRGDEPRTYRLDAGSDDLAERLMAIRGGRTGVKAKILVDPAACFMRTLVLPSAALPRMRAVLAQELEAATPFRAAAVHSDWYVEGEDAATRSLRVHHVVLKRARLDPLLATLAHAGLAAGPVTVGQDEDRTMPVDLLSGGHRAFSSLARGATRVGNLILVAGAMLLALCAFQGLRQHQDATLSLLDEAFRAVRRAAGPPVPPQLQAGIVNILAERGPPLARTWDALAAALPDTVSAVDLRLDVQGLTLTLAAPDEASALAALAALPGFGPPVLREVAAHERGRRVVVALPLHARGGRP